MASASIETCLHAARAGDVREVDEDALRRFGAQVVQALLVVDGPEESLEQTREVLGLGPRPGLTGVGVGHIRQTVRRGPAVFGFVGLEEVVCTVALVRVKRFDERVREDLDVAGHLPDAARQDDRGIDADDILAPLNEGLPPLTLDVLLQRGAEGAVVPGRSRPAVDLAGLEDEPPSLGEIDDGVEIVAAGHGYELLCARPSARAHSVSRTRLVRSACPPVYWRRASTPRAVRPAPRDPIGPGTAVVP